MQTSDRQIRRENAASVLKEKTGVSRAEMEQLKHAEFPASAMQDAFRKGVVSRLKHLGYTIADRQSLYLAVRDCYVRQKITMPRAVQDWFRKENGIPSTDQAYRNNLYQFCCALEMNLEETAEFFHEHFLTIPFNFKDRTDAVWFYGLYHKKTYPEILALTAAAKTFPMRQTTEKNTAQIGNRLLEIDQDEAFLSFLRDHCYDRESQNRTARHKIRTLAEQCRAIAPNEKDILNIRTGVQKNSELLSSILGYRYQSIDAEQRKKLKTSGLPVFPRDGDLSSILNGKEISFDVLRKTLILLEFYLYYTATCKQFENQYMPDAEIYPHFCEFYAECSSEMAECGFVSLYQGHPFDRVILHCAAQNMPTDYLKDLISPLSDEEDFLSDTADPDGFCGGTDS